MRINDWSSDVCSSDLFDPCTTWNISAAIRDAINARLIEGPRMVSAGKYISTYNSIGSQFPTWVNHPPSTNSVICNTKDEMVTEVRRQAKDRVDLIKVAGDGDVIRSSGFEEASVTLEENGRASGRERVVQTVSI